MNVVNSNDVVGMKVKNIQGENLGKIEALILDELSGKMDYVVLSFGGFLGMGDKWFAMPWHVFTYDADQEKLVINIDQEKLKNSPGFDKDHWTDLNDTTYTQSIERFYH